MSLYEQWQALASSFNSQQEADSFWNNYFAAEQKNYQYILDNTDETYEASLAELASKFSMEPTIFVGFIDGINSSLKEAIAIEGLEEETNVKLDIDFEKLYFNMLDAKAEWLYTLPQWDDVLPLARRKEIKKEYGDSKTVRKGPKIGRNDPCPCGSGKKYKHCCMNK